MKSISQINKERQNNYPGTLKSYIIGYFLSCFLTLIAYYLVENHIQFSTGMFNSTFLVFVVLGLATVQALVQLLFFLHLGHESKPRLKLIIFLFAVIVIIIVVGGSLWIMQNLNYRMMSSPSEINNYMKNQSGL